MEIRKIYSPDKKHSAGLDYLGEIKFGPAYYRLFIDDAEIKERIFGEALLWSDDSVYLAAQEWMHADIGKKPATRAVIFDIIKGRFSNFKVFDGGYTGDFVFNKGLFVYRKHDYYHGNVYEAEVELTKISNWKK